MGNEAEEKAYFIVSSAHKRHCGDGGCKLFYGKFLLTDMFQEKIVFLKLYLIVAFLLSL